MTHAYPIEVVNLLAALVGMVLLLWALYDAAKDANGLRAAGQNGPRSVIAIGNVLRGGFRVLLAFFFSTGGFVAVMLPPPPDFEVSPEAKLALVIGRWVVIAATAVIVLDAFVERWYRRKYVRTLRGRFVPPVLFAPPPGRVEPGVIYPDPLERRKDYGLTTKTTRRSTDPPPPTEPKA